MADVFTAPKFLDDLKVLLDADATLSTLTSPKYRSTTYWPSPAEAQTDVVSLGYRCTDDTEHASIGQQRYDQVVRCESKIEIIRPGAGESVAAAARLRATTILDRIHINLRDNRPTVGLQTIEARIIERDMQQYPSEIGDAKTPVRVCEIGFVIRYAARTE